MSTEKQWSFVMAERLKQLRESKGLSHDRLSSALSAQYGISVSSDSLMNYEVTGEFHSKKYKNLGMRVEYLRYFSDFYNVSTDYILGLDDDPSRTPVATKELHLSPQAVQLLAERAKISDGFSLGLSALLEQSSFLSACRYIGKIVRLKNEPQHYKNSFSKLLESTKAPSPEAAEASLSTGIKKNAMGTNPGLGQRLEVLVGSQMIDYHEYKAIGGFNAAVKNIRKGVNSDGID